MPIRTGSGPDLTGRVEELVSVRRVARSAVNDFLGGTGLFPPTPRWRRAHSPAARRGSAGFGPIRWNLTADVLAGDGPTTGRLYGDVRQPLRLPVWGSPSRLKAGVATEPAMPQTLYRLGGLGTVRGFEYGAIRGACVLGGSARCEPLRARVRPVIFLDAGQASRSRAYSPDRSSWAVASESRLFSGLIRSRLQPRDLARCGGKVRFDIVIRGVR